MHEVRRVHEEHRSPSLPGFLQTRLQFRFEEIGLGLNVLFERGLGGNRNGGHLARFQPQAV